MIALERELAQDWQNLFYPPGPEMPEERPAPVEGAGGAAFGVFPAMRSAASRTGEISPAGKMLPADVAAGALKGTVTGGVGLPGDIESLVRGIRGIFTRGGDQGKLDAFLAGLEEKTILPTSEDVNQWLDANVGPVVPPGAPMAEQRAGVAKAGQLAGELTSGPATLIKGAKVTGRAAARAGKALAPKAGEMLGDYMRRAGLTPELMAYHGTPHRFAPEEGAPLGRFRSEKIGTGERAQAYGYGLYFAEAPGVAAGYKSTLSSNLPNRLTEGGKKVNPDTLYGRALEHAAKLKNGGWSADEAKKSALQQIDDSIRFNEKYSPDTANMYRSVRRQLEDADLSKVKLQQGSLYTVDIPDEMIGKMLDYDKPLSSQPAELQSKLKAVVDAEVGPGVWESWIKNEPDFRNLKDDLLETKTDAEVSALLRQAGIPGIRYLDAGSREAGGTHNIVVFPGEEDKVKILKVE